MEIKVLTTIKGWYDDLAENVKNRTEALYIGISKENEVSYGWQKDVDLDYCNEHNIKTYYMDRNGGTFVCFKGNISIAWIYKPQKYGRNMLQAMLGDLAKYLSSKGLKIGFDNNDLVVDNDNKVAGIHSYNLAPEYRWTYEATEISINVDMELIRNICKKEIKKIPTGLSNYGITTEEVWNWIFEWLRTNVEEFNI